MNIMKAIGRIAEFRGNSCRIEVLSFKKNGVNVTVLSDIKIQFPPNGHVFAPKFCESYDYTLNTIVEFTTSSMIPSLKGDNMDGVLMDIGKPCKQTGFRVFNFPKSILFNELSFNQPQLKSYVREELSHFYIKVLDYLYGPFRSTNADVTPKSGVVVNKYKMISKEYCIDDEVYLLSEPEEIIGQVDCMSQTQLAGFFKEQIRSLGLEIDFNYLKRALETQPLQGLDVARMQRLLANLEGLSLAQYEIKSLVNFSEKFELFYQNELTKANEEIRKAFISPVLFEKKELERSVNDLTTNLKKLKKEEDNFTLKVEKLQKEHRYLSQERDRLIDDIKAHALINDGLGGPSRLFTYEDLHFSHKVELYSNLDEFIDLVDSSIYTGDNAGSKYAHRAIHQLKYHRCFLCSNIWIIMQIAKLTNNCRVIMQQVEPDWLKFESLFSNGLERAWRSAHESPDILHLFILQDLNMASIECYGRPLLDLADGVRTRLPSTELSWPDNLWIFGLPITHLTDDFGLSLIPETFNSWGAFQIDDNISIDSKTVSGKYLNPSQLFDHSIVTAGDISQYFMSR